MSGFPVSLIVWTVLVLALPLIVAVALWAFSKLGGRS